MNNHRRKALSCLLAILLPVLLFCGCSGPSQGLVHYDIPYSVENLDPQYAADDISRMILANVCEGLLVQNPDGSLSSGVAQSYTVSPDGLIYTFRLYTNKGWRGADVIPVTAHDFVFAFQRLLAPSSGSPYADDFLLIENAAAVRSGQMAGDALGVKAMNDTTLIIALTEPSFRFPALLATTAAMPCNPAQFRDARGRYGLEKKYVSANGRFYVESWTGQQIRLRSNENYQPGQAPPAVGVNLYIGKENNWKRFADNVTDLAQVPATVTNPLGAKNTARIVSYTTTTWCLVFNQKDSVWGNPLLRQSLAHALSYDMEAQNPGEGLAKTDEFLPPAVLWQGSVYRTLTEPQPNPLGYDTETALRLSRLGLEALNLNSLPPIEIFVPNTGSHAAIWERAGKNWRNQLGATTQIRPITEEELWRRWETGEFQALVLPFTPTDSSPESLLKLFKSTAAGNGASYQSPQFDRFLAEAITAQTPELAIMRLSQAERILLADAVLIPAYTQSTTYALSKDATGVEMYPFGGMIRFAPYLA